MTLACSDSRAIQATASVTSAPATAITAGTSAIFVSLRVIGFETGRPLVPLGPAASGSWILTSGMGAALPAGGDGGLAPGGAAGPFAGGAAPVGFPPGVTACLPPPDPGFLPAGATTDLPP